MKFSRVGKFLSSDETSTSRVLLNILVSNNKNTLAACIYITKKDTLYIIDKIYPFDFKDTKRKAKVRKDILSDTYTLKSLTASLTKFIDNYPKLTAGTNYSNYKQTSTACNHRAFDTVLLTHIESVKTNDGKDKYVICIIGRGVFITLNLDEATVLRDQLSLFITKFTETFEMLEKENQVL